MNKNANALGGLLYLSIGCLYLGLHNHTILAWPLHTIGVVCLITFFEKLPKYIREIKTKYL